MIAHLFRLVWNRKRANALILLEIFLSFTVLFSICSASIYYWNNTKKPLGFQYEDVWIMTISSPPGIMDKATRQEGLRVYDDLIRHVRSKDKVLAAGATNVIAYGGSDWNTRMEHDGRRYLTYYAPATVGFDKAMDLEMLQGRFYEEPDLVMNMQPLVINEALAELMFADESPLGKRMELDGAEYRITGVFRDYRHKGEFYAPLLFAICPPDFSGERAWLPQELAMKMAPGTSMAFEAELMRELEAMAPGWSFKTTTLERMRGSHLTNRIAMFSIFGLIGVFMLVMVAMGLVGVLWQSVTRRTAELGVRRAKGATRKMIHVQILGELMVLTTLAVVLALIPIAQLPILGIIDHVGTGVLAAGFGFAVVMIFVITTVAGLYPSWLATTVNPAEALHYE